MIVQTFPAGPFETNAYVVSCQATNEAAIIDPAPESSERILTYLQNETLRPTKILLTHSHLDHIADVKALCQKLSLPVYIHPLDAPNLEKPGSDGLPLFFPVQGVKPDGLFQEGDKVTIGRLKFEVIHTPGHSPGGVCFYEPNELVLISGDTLFQGTIGNLSFPTANEEKMWKSLEKLSKLPAETKVYPGHGPATTIQDEPWLPHAKEHFGG